MSVEPGISWNKLQQHALTSSGPIQVWTLNGSNLDSVTFFIGIPEGEPLLKRRADKDAPLPIFRADMREPEIMDLIEATLSKSGQTSLIETRKLRPATLDGIGGFRFEMSYVGQDNIDREATAVGCVRGGKLYLLLYQGTRLYHYERYLPDVERLIESVRFAGA